jgi:hypothetical protein
MNSTHPWALLLSPYQTQSPRGPSLCEPGGRSHLQVPGSHLTHLHHAFSRPHHPHLPPSMELTVSTQLCSSRPPNTSASHKGHQVRKRETMSPFSLIACMWHACTCVHMCVHTHMCGVNTCSCVCLCVRYAHVIAQEPSMPACPCVPVRAHVCPCVPVRATYTYVHGCPCMPVCVWVSTCACGCELACASDVFLLRTEL